MGRISLMFTCLAVLMLVSAGSVGARERLLAHKTDGTLVGPVLSEGRVVWGESRPDLTGKRLRMATARGRPRVILRIPEPASGQTNFRSLAASGRRIAVLVGGYDPASPGQLWVSSARRFSRVALAPGCDARAADIDGSRIAYLAHCGGGLEVRVRGTGEAIRVNGVPLEFRDQQIRLAGRYLAYAEHGFPTGLRLVVHDLRRRAQALRVDLTPYVQGGYEGVVNKWVHFDLDERGRVAFKAGTEPETSPRIVGWASPGHPAIRRLRHRARGGPPAIADGLIAMQRGGDYAVVDLKGEVVDVFERRRTRGGGTIAFDGRRLAWTGMTRTRAFPGSRWDLVTDLLDRKR